MVMIVILNFQIHFTNISGQYHLQFVWVKFNDSAGDEYLLDVYKAASTRNHRI